MSYFEVVLETIQEINANLQAVHASIKRQTELLVMMKNQSSANESANKAQEAAPAPKAITWQAAVRYLHDYCGSITEVECNKGVCPMASFCGRHLKGRFSSMPCNWEVPDDE